VCSSAARHHACVLRLLARMHNAAWLRVTLLAACAVAALSFSCVAITPAAVCAALGELYEFTNGPGWTFQNGWEAAASDGISTAPNAWCVWVDAEVHWRHTGLCSPPKGSKGEQCCTGPLASGAALARTSQSAANVCHSLPAATSMECRARRPESSQR
jgi:hypothetical protein